MLCESPQRQISPVMLGSAIQEQSYLFNTFWCFRSCRAACFCTCVPVYFSVCSRDQHTQLSSGWDHGFVFKSRALQNNFPFVCFVLPCMGDLQAWAQPSPPEVVSLLLGQGLGRASGELLKERIVSLENGAPLVLFFHN